MDQAGELALLKMDLQMITTANDALLSALLEQAGAEIAREGITLADTVPDTMIKVQYAAYLFRRRAADETVMPRFLRWQLNNRLFQQKVREG